MLEPFGLADCQIRLNLCCCLDQWVFLVIPEVQSGTVGLQLKVNFYLHSLLLQRICASSLHSRSRSLMRGWRVALLTASKTHTLWCCISLSTYLYLPTSHSSSSMPCFFCLCVCCCSATSFLTAEPRLPPSDRLESVQGPPPPHPPPPLL